ncbi:MAG: hypothetical protein KDC05_04965 [Bacteroidales bacterium]|nr:hypothetical protein [Bacteroidales bacterium]
MKKTLQIIFVFVFLAGFVNFTQAVDITFRVDMSNETSVDPSGVHIAGSFQGWNPGATALNDMGGGIWETTISLTTGDYHEYKFINGNSWGQDEVISGLCGSGGNRFIHVPDQNTVLATVCFKSCNTCASSGTVEITFQVDMTNEDVSGNGVHVAGSFQGWDASSTQLTDQGNGIYAKTLTLNAGEYHEYKFLNGNSWGTDESVPSGCNHNNNRYFIVPENDETLPLVCFASCEPCVTVVDVDITFRVDMSNETISPDGVHIAGSFQGWDPSSSLMNDAGGGIYEATFTIQSGSYHEYKFINGDSWNSPDVPENVFGPCGAGNSNRFIVVPEVNTILPVNCFGSCGPCSSTWNGSAKSSDWHDAGNWDSGVPGSGTNVTIPAGLSTYPNISASAECNDIHFGSDASGAATLIDNSYLTVNGTASVERYFSGNDVDWHLVSSPVSDATANVFFDMFLQSFDETTNTYTWITDETDPLNVMEGYGLYSTLAAANTVTFFGDLNFGNQSEDFTANNMGWNLMGNPFVSSIDWDAVTIPAGMSNEVHYIEASTGNDLSYVKGLGGSGSRYIPPMQGFFVSATGSGTFTIGDADRTHAGAGTFYKKDNPQLLVLEAGNADYADETWIHFNAEAGEEHDGQFDAYKRISTSNPQLPQIFSYTPSGVKLGVNGMPQITSVPVGFTAVESGEFTISTKETGEFTEVILEDLLVGEQVNLLDESYTFNYISGSLEDRFLVHFATTDVTETLRSNIRIYSQNNSVFVGLPATIGGEIKVFNLMGQEVVSQSAKSGLNQIAMNNNGTFIVMVVCEEIVRTEKVFLK